MYRTELRLYDGPRDRARSRSPRSSESHRSDIWTSRREGRYDDRRRRRSPSPAPLARQSKHDANDVTQPKNFARPLTCFYWKQYGFCKKRDVDCIYAHWDTGYMASAPVSLPTAIGKACVAGKRANEYMSGPLTTSTIDHEKENSIAVRVGQLRVREEQLQAREDAVATRENDVATRECAVASREDVVSAKEAELQKSAKLKEKDLKMREKTIERQEQALKNAASITGTCAKCNTTGLSAEAGDERMLEEDQDEYEPTDICGANCSDKDHCHYLFEEEVVEEDEDNVLY